LKRAAYIHIPFCISKCHYCDFNSYPGMSSLFDSYAQAVAAEIRSAVRGRSRAATLYVGGGTPTLLSEQQLYTVVEAAQSVLGLSSEAEATIEANPATADRSKMEGLLTIGFNRISIGAQSFEDVLLERAGRAHTANDIRDVIIDARFAGFANLSLDFIYSLPGQDIPMWQDTLREAAALKPDHISLYELTVEQGTPFAEMLAQGKLDLPNEDTQIEMYSLAQSTLESEGYEHYEISNFAKPGFRCEHNQFYWRNEEYYGFGAGAVSYLDGKRAKNVANPQEYIQRIQDTGSAVESVEELPVEAVMGETMMLGLRMSEGVDLARFRERFGVDIERVYQPELERMSGLGLLEMDESRVRLTSRGVLLANEVMAEFVRTA
jgi:oxygen-independent coproporphyrinogen-3 oxidase